MPVVQLDLDEDNPDSIDAFMRQRQQAQSAQTPDAWAAGNQAYGQALRTGQDLDLQQPSDVLAYGAGLSPGQGAAPSTASANGAGAPSTHPTQGQLPEPILRANAALRAASNAVTFGGADHFAAAMDALLAPGGLDRWKERYDANMQDQKAQDAYDLQHRPAAQATGSIGGGLLGVVGMGPLEGALAGAPRLAGAAKLTAREALAITGASGATGLGSQGLTDLATHHLSTPGDYAGSAIGGIAGGGSTLLNLGPARAGAIDGAVTSAAQDIFNGRPISAQQAADSAILGNLVGGVAGSAGRNGSNALSKTDKGVLGETLGKARAVINDEARTGGSKKRASVYGLDVDATNQKGTYWYPDGRAGPVAYEDKFGIGADLTPNQKFARKNMGQDFRLNSFVPSDIGRMTGLPAAQFAPQAVKRSQDQQEKLPWE